MEQRARDFEVAAAILRSELPRPEKVFLNNFARRDLGADVSHFVQDVRRFESTSRKTDCTWPRAGDALARRRSENTMGIQPSRTRKVPGGRQIQSSP